MLSKNNREACDEREITTPKNALVSYRKDLGYLLSRMQYMQKLYGIRSLAGWFDEASGSSPFGGWSEVDSERDPIRFTGYHAYSSQQDIITRFDQGRPVSCFRLDNSTTEVHVAYTEGERRGETVTIMTFVFDPSTGFVQDTGSHFCKFWPKLNNDGGDNLTEREVRKEIEQKMSSYAIMLPLIHAEGTAFDQRYTLIYHDWEVLRCDAPGGYKGRASLDHNLFENSLSFQ